LKTALSIYKILKTQDIEDMAKDLDDSTKSLGTVFCFILIAYIFYFLGSLSSQHELRPESHVNPTTPCDRPCCRQAEVTAPKEANRIEDDRQSTLSAMRESEAKRALQEMRELERKMRIGMENWNDERRLEIKKMREEQLRWLWDSKQKKERGVMSWLGGGKKKR
jgi:hypothetical protein